MISPLHRKLGLLPLILCLLSPQQTHSSRRSAVQQGRTPNIARHFKMLGFTLGPESTLSEVQARLGKSAVRRCAVEELELCYVAGTSQTRVVFEAGPGGCLEGFRVIAGSLRQPCYSGCTRASQMTGDVRTEGGLKLGLTRERLIALLGPPKEIRGNKLTFEWDSRQAMTKREEEAESKTFNEPIANAYWDVQDTIEVVLADSRVVEFEVNHVLSY